MKKACISLSCLSALQAAECNKYDYQFKANSCVESNMAEFEDPPESMPLMDYCRDECDKLSDCGSVEDHGTHCVLNAHGNPTSECSQYNAGDPIDLYVKGNCIDNDESETIDSARNATEGRMLRTDSQTELYQEDYYDNGRISVNTNSYGWESNKGKRQYYEATQTYGGNG